MQEIDDYLSKARQLPPAPQTLPRLLTLLGEPDADMSDVVKLISFDPALTAGLLQNANSAFFASANPVTHVEEALARLGFARVYHLVAGMCVGTSFAAIRPGWGLDGGMMWRHAVATALAAQQLARELGEDENVIFTAGLLHDVGKVIFAFALEHIYGKLVEEVEKNQYSLLEEEQRLLGVGHDEVGAKLLTRWNFVPGMVNAIGFHHRPQEAGQHQRLASCICLGNLMAHFLGFGSGLQAVSFKGRDEALKVLGLRADRLPIFMNEAMANVTMVEALLNLQR